MEYEAVVEAFVRERDKVVDSVRRIGIVRLEDDGAFVRLYGYFMHKVFNGGR